MPDRRGLFHHGYVLGGRRGAIRRLTGMHRPVGRAASPDTRLRGTNGTSAGESCIHRRRGWPISSSGCRAGGLLDGKKKKNKSFGEFPRPLHSGAEYKI